MKDPDFNLDLSLPLFFSDVSIEEESSFDLTACIIGVVAGIFVISLVVAYKRRCSRSNTPATLRPQVTINMGANTGDSLYIIISS